MTLIETIDKIRALRVQADEEWAACYDPYSDQAANCQKLRDQADELEAELHSRTSWSAGDDFRELLADAVAVIEGLAEQQAMPDDWYEEPLAKFKRALD